MILPRACPWPEQGGTDTKGCGWSQQQPALRSTQRDETAIGTGGSAALPNSKNALAEGRAIPASSAGPALWADASGFYLLPALLRTWAPVGQTPVIRRQLSYDHRSAISAISLTGELYLAVQDHAYRGPDVVEFLQSASGGLVIWDGAPIHRCRAVNPPPADWRRAPRDGSGWSSCPDTRRN